MKAYKQGWRGLYAKYFPVYWMQNGSIKVKKPNKWDSWGNVNARKSYLTLERKNESTIRNQKS